MAGGNELTAVAWFSIDVALVLVVFWTARRASRERSLRLEEQSLREEMEVYAALDPRVMPGESPRALARRVCATVAQHSVFRQVAMLMRDEEDRLRVVGGSGVDDLMTLAIHEWGDRVGRGQHKDTPPSERRRSYPVILGPMEAFDARLTLSLRGCRQVMVLPLWSQAGAMLGALVVWPVVDESEGSLMETLQPLAPKLMPCERALAPLESLSQKLGRVFDLTQINERLLRAEKMAGLGYLANGVAHELNNPLTAVLGFAELIAETATEPRVREDAVAIVGQAMRMREIVDSLLQFWRPITPADATVDVAQLLLGVAAQAEGDLARRGVELVLTGESNEGCCVHGDEQRLLKVFEHLLNNAVQAVTGYKDRVGSIRMTLSCDGERVRVVVSDSGPGFADAARVFDPFYTTRQPGEGQGMGLAVSYGIVREHGGEISVFNVHPHGAAVVVELPLARTVKEVAQSLAAR